MVAEEDPLKYNLETSDKTNFGSILYDLHE